MTTAELPGAKNLSGTVADVETEHRWLIRVWVLVFLFALVTVAWSIHVGIPIRDPHGSILASRVAISLGLFAAMSLVDASIRVGRRGWSVRRTLTMLRTRWPWRRLVLAMGGLAAYHIVYFCYHNLKSWDVLNTPRDAMLLAWDRWLFFGHSPAVLLHDLLGEHVAAWVLVVLYESFGTIVLFAIPMPMVFVTRIRDGYVAIASALWVWILGTVLLLPDPLPRARSTRRRRSSPACRTRWSPRHRRATWTSERTCSRTRPRATPSPRSRRSPACTWASPA